MSEYELTEAMDELGGRIDAATHTIARTAEVLHDTGTSVERAAELQVQTAEILQKLTDQAARLLDHYGPGRPPAPGTNGVGH